jgi:hypothetical protein
MAESFRVRGVGGARVDAPDEAVVVDGQGVEEKR